MLLFISRLPVIYWQSVCRLNGIVLQYECRFQGRGRTPAGEGSELDRSGECTICKHPLPFFIHVSGQQEQAVQCPSLRRAGGKAAWKSAAIFKPCFLFSGDDLQVLGPALEAVLKLTWFSPLTACWVNSKPTCSSSCSGISHIWWTFSVLIA